MARNGAMKRIEWKIDEALSQNREVYNAIVGNWHIGRFMDKIGECPTFTEYFFHGHWFWEGFNLEKAKKSIKKELKFYIYAVLKKNFAVKFKAKTLDDCVEYTGTCHGLNVGTITKENYDNVWWVRANPKRRTFPANSLSEAKQAIRDNLKEFVKDVMGNGNERNTQSNAA